ncbi:hypothetical protein MASR1M45_17070 [Candidatus Kapaibacterium sp.]
MTIDRSLSDWHKPDSVVSSVLDETLRLISIMPNPSNSEIHFELSINGNYYDIQITNLDGVILKKFDIKSDNRYIWDLKDNNGKSVPSGIYFLIMKNSINVYSYKFVVER